MAKSALDRADWALYHREASRGRPLTLQRSRFTHLLQRDGVHCLFHALTMRMVYGGDLLGDLYEVFAEATPVEHAISRCSAKYSSAIVNQVVADLWQDAMLVQGPDEDVQAYRSLYQRARENYHVRHMYMLPTTACNFRCRYCFVEDDERHLEPTFMSTAIAESALTVFAKLTESQPAMVTFYGGEPLLNPKATFFALRFLHQLEAEGKFAKNLRIALLTNGSLVNPEAISVFKETRPSVGVSIDGPQPLHDAARIDLRGCGTFDMVLAGYKRLQDAGLQPGISCTLNAFTIGHMDEIVDFILSDLKPKSVGFNLLLPRIGRQTSSSNLDHPFAVQQLIKAFGRLRETGIYEDRMMRRVRPFIEQRPHLKDCMGVGGQLVVTPTGRVGPCQAFLGVDDRKYFPLEVQQLAAKGNLLSSEFIYSEGLFDEWRHRFPINMSECANCFAVSVCGGGCPYAAEVTCGSIWKIDERVCYQAKGILEWMIWDTYEHMNKNNQKQSASMQSQPLDGLVDSLMVPGLSQRSVASKYDSGKGQNTMEQWFHMKYHDDLSDIRPEAQGYYKHYVHNFVTSFFTQDRVAGRKILDFGCGPGFYSAILAQRGAHVTGIDRSQFLIQKANEHKVRLGLANVEFIQADFVDFSSNWDSGSFDYVIAIDTIVSFDYCSAIHNHDRVVKAFRGVSRLLKENGRFFIIESHPLFGHASREMMAKDGEYYYIRPAGYKIEYKQKDYPHHWFTLDEMTKATSESGLAVFRIYEPDPSIALKKESPEAYSFRLKYPGMIVYEVCKVAVHPSLDRGGSALGKPVV
jgi:uncharacterized protein